MSAHRLMARAGLLLISTAAAAGPATGPGGTAAAAGPAVRQAGSAPGTQLWARSYGAGVAVAAAVSPGGARVFVTGATGTGGSSVYGTVAYNAATGTQLWASTYGVSGVGGSARAVAVSPDGARVFVTGNDATTFVHNHYATVAYNAATGAQLWARRYQPTAGNDEATSIAASPDGSTVYVTGYSGDAGTGYDYATIAYDAATGARRWVSRYNGPASKDDYAQSLTVSPDGSTVVVTGRSDGAYGASYYATVAYNARTGAREWVSRYNGRQASGGRAFGFNQANAVRFSPGGGTVFVTGQSFGRNSDCATVAYSARTGAQEWASRYNGPADGEDYARSIAVSPAGGAVYVTGSSHGASHFDLVTIAYDARTGAREWVSRYDGQWNTENFGVAVAVGPGGDEVYVTGTSQTPLHSSAVTAAYSAATGAREWVDLSPAGNSSASAIAVSRTTDAVFVTGAGQGYLTIAYRG